jgi:hypothetical protein
MPPPPRGNAGAQWRLRGDQQLASPRISVVRSWGIKHSFDTREFVIGQAGFYLIPLEENLFAALPLQSYSSLLRRAPARPSLSKRIDGAPAAQERQ